MLSNAIGNHNDQITDIYDYQKINEISLTDGVTYNKSKKLSQDDLVNLNKDWKAYKQETNNLFGREKLSYLNFNDKSFDIIPTFTYKSFLKLFLLGNLIILSFFEILRKIFYYVTLGTLKPKK